ncbi:adenylate cyclase [Abditibacterium utsteinense]|uniref:Adenylate cyclase n=1 Tax=Abditibacterium utsteinense TaxID=1960156 RepID=A0A2S8SVZ8_9BACT|nr:adenylate/guanylate cyclase domain-containing protein [Abditibacterium utsteinense]PQV64971.1 adenylate cyclase [Abditibacterium utsteinense]
MRISLRFRDFDTTFERDTTTFVIGRPKAGTQPPDIDLSPDRTVSRPHARFFQQKNVWHLEDLGSTHGTQLSGREIRGLGPQILRSGDTFQCGETVLRPEIAASENASLAPAESEISMRVPAPGEAGFGDLPAAASLHLGRIYDLLLRCGQTNDLDELMRQIVGRVVQVLPDARRGALLLHSRETDALLLTCFHGEGGPAVSETLARRAMEEKQGLLWRGENEESGASGESIARFAISSALVAPLLWRGEALGVLCLDNPQGAPFSASDLSVAMIVAHHMALALANRRLAEELRRESNLKANLLRQFSPQYREQLLNPGGLQLSGERGEVTILVSDIRGFEALTRHMEPVAVIEMLNDYFSRLSPIVWAHNGSIDKYIGDAILAVFGSPNKDPKQHENALRAALEMQADMAKSNEARAKKGKVTCEIGIGVHCGEALHGFMGVLDQFSLTVIGDAVNRAGRYCDGARAGEIMLSPQVYQWVWKGVEAAPAQIVTKHGETLPAFRLMGFGDPRD